MATPNQPAPGQWRNRITRYGEEAPENLLAHEKNWRIHPGPQQQALKAVLRDVGFVQNVIVSERTGKCLDGHLRIQLAISEDQATVPITYVDVSEEEEALILATLDPLAAMAVTDQALFASLASELKVTDEALAAMIAHLPETGSSGGGVTGSQPTISLAERFGVPPFSVLDARQGYWQERKRAWLALGIESELGRGGEDPREVNRASPGGSMRPTVDKATGKITRADGHGRSVEKRRAAR